MKFRFATVVFLTLMTASGPAESGTAPGTQPSASNATPEQFGCALTFSDLNDDTNCVQAMLDSGAPDMFLPRTYRIRRTLTFSGSNRRLHARDMWFGGFSVASNQFDLFKLKGPGPLILEDMTLVSWGQSGSHLFYSIKEDASKPVMYLQLRHLFLQGWDNAIRSVGTYADFSDIFIRNTVGGAGITFQTNSEVKSLHNSSINGGKYGILINGGSAFDFISLELMGSDYAIAVITPDRTPVNSLKMVDVWADNTKEGGLLLDSRLGGAHRITAEASWFCSSKGSGIIVRGRVQGLWIANSEICDNAYDGIVVEAPAIGAETNISGMMLNGNRFSGNKGTAIDIKAGVSNFTVTANIIGPAADFGPNGTGIKFGSSGIDDFLVTDNKITGNPISVISVASGHRQLWGNNLEDKP